MPVLQLPVVAALIAANGFFVLAEFTLTRVRPTQVAAWERQRRPGAGSARHALERLDPYLAACQLGITVASLGLGAVGEPAFHELLAPVLGDAARVGSVGLAGGLAFGIITLLHVVAGELAPKSVAIARTERTTLLVAPPMRLFYLATKPFVDLLNALANLLLKPFGIPPAREAGVAPPTEDELRQLLRESARQGLIDPDEQLLSENALTFDDLRVREIMTPRRAVHYVTTDMDLAGVVERLRATGAIRLPLCEPRGGLDAPVGVIDARGVLVAFAEEGGHASPPTAGPLERVPEAMRVNQLLRHMRRRGEQLVLVADEFGTTVGAVAFENLVEVIIGELGSEADGKRPSSREEGELVVSGSAFVHAVARMLGVALPDVRQATIAGVVAERLGRIPRVGDVVDLDGLRLEVSEVLDGRAAQLRVVQPATGVGRKPPGAHTIT